MELEITSESTSAFAIQIDGKAAWLEQRGGEWRLDGFWIASRRIEWPEALARALRAVTNTGLNYRTRQAVAVRKPHD